MVRDLLPDSWESAVDFVAVMSSALALFILWTFLIIRLFAS